MIHRGAFWQDKRASMPEIFISILRASKYSYLEACDNQTLPFWVPLCNPNGHQNRDISQFSGPGTLHPDPVYPLCACCAHEIDYMFIKMKNVYMTCLLNAWFAMYVNLLSDTTEFCKNHLPKTAYSKELIELLFVQPYTNIEFPVEHEIAELRTASKYLKQVEKK